MFGCLIFDFLDGLIARAFQLYHPLGGQLDSLADMVSFGAAPGIIAFDLLAQNQSSFVLASLALVFPACAAVRLARFNLEDENENHFVGMPSPAAALFIFGLYLLDTWTGCEDCKTIMLNVPTILISTLVLPALMVSKLPHFNLKVKHLGWSGNEIRWIFLVLSLLLVIFLRQAAISSIIVLYILLSLIAQSLKRKAP